VSTWDIAVVGAGPAGAATALGALRAEPGLKVALLDRSDFPRDKCCGDGIAPHILDLLEGAGVHGLLDDQVPVHRLRLSRGTEGVDGVMARPTYVVPRTVFDERLVRAAQEAGASLVRHRVRRVHDGRGSAVVDGGLGEVEARVVIGADGAHSAVRRSLGLPRPPTAVALRGYVPTPPEREGAQVIVFGTERGPSYAWSFDRGDGFSNVGYGEFLTERHDHPTRVSLMSHLERLLPGSTDDGQDWRAAPLPLSGWRSPSYGRGRVLLAGDAASLVNPMTGEGIYYAVETGLEAGRAAAASLAVDAGTSALHRYRSAARRLLGRHRRHSAFAARLARSGRVLDTGLRASAVDQGVYDALVEIGLAKGHITPPLVRGLAAEIWRHHRTHHHEESRACAS
jgi:geranylgeranyl reductase family protein